MKLNDQQIQDLYSFTRQHYVEHYDVQTELVDHLANDIEQIWERFPALTFEQARDKSFKKFGVFGFMNVVEEKQKQMNKKYFKLILSFVKEWFKLPKIAVTIMLFVIFYQLQEFSQAYNLYMAVYFTIIFIELFKIYQFKKKIKDKTSKTGKKWMLEDIMMAQGIGSVVLIMFYAFEFSLPNNKELIEMSELRRFFVSLMVVLTILVSYITLIVIPQKSEELLEKHYPEYKLIAN
ncbi:hypothetical protein WH52_04380 [Tenacibaculum holothuriorum]|uniref:Uncharacterized protein n=1 Tax=Tenacibaculum holothuriorum TaxID=1635173 RepID=A0A1Y2PEI5_9FLAO|nr:hypothetical protein [Tenacibaculum holothuriorum]OSY88906.1 hypothetical protein WH52_04380 [Tenacibaculum holothuriorum]